MTYQSKEIQGLFTPMLMNKVVKEVGHLFSCVYLSYLFEYGGKESLLTIFGLGHWYNTKPQRYVSINDGRHRSCDQIQSRNLREVKDKDNIEEVQPNTGQGTRKHWP